jgi:DNA topoisomerase-3
MWRDNKFFKLKHITLTKKQASEFLKNGRVFVNGLYSEKNVKTYDAWVVLDDNGGFVRYRIEFERRSS